MALAEHSPLYIVLRDLYRDYRQTQDIDDKKPFFSQECRQMCRTDPSYAARDADTIIRYLHEAGPLVSRILQEVKWQDGESPVDLATSRSFYSTRPLSDDELGEFGTAAELSPAGFSSAEEIRNKADTEKWAGLKVNMWTDDGRGRGLLVKVKYWWRREPVSSSDGAWKQILHDILYLGPTDGSEGGGGGERFED